MTRYGIRDLDSNQWFRRLKRLELTIWPTQALWFPTMSEAVVALIEADLDQDKYEVQPLPSGKEG